MGSAFVGRMAELLRDNKLVAAGITTVVVGGLVVFGFLSGGGGDDQANRTSAGSGRSAAGDTGSETGAASADEGGGSDGGSRRGRGSVAAPGSPNADVPGASADAPPVTATTVKVGFIVIDPQATTNYLSALGVVIPNQGDPVKQVEATVKWVNDHGGVAGRKIIPVIRTRDPNSSNPNQMEELCVEMTEGNHVFAVVSNAGADTSGCYKKHNTLFLCNCTAPAAFGRDNAPYLWAPGITDADSGYAALTDGLIDQKFFSKGSKLGIVIRDAPEERGFLEKIIKPRLKKINYEVSETAYIIDSESSAQTGQYVQELEAAAVRFKLQGIDRVMFMYPGGGAPLFFMQAAESQRYYPNYGLSSFDQPAFILQGNIPESQLENSIGVGWNTGLDVDEAKAEKYPAGKGETQCFEALKAAGIPPAERGNSLSAASVACDGAFMVQAAARNLGAELTATRWAQAAGNLGTTFQSAVSLPDATKFTGGHPFGGAFYRHFRYDNPGCSCYFYTTGNRPIVR